MALLMVKAIGVNFRDVLNVRDAVFPLFQKAVVDETGRATTPMDFILRVSAGRFDASPFNGAILDQARRVVAGLLGGVEDLLKVEPGQCFRLDLIAQLLKRAVDPDWAFCNQLKKGLPLGVDAVMDRTPRVFEEKTRWKLNEVDGPGARECENYLSLDGHLKEVEELFKEEESLGWMMEMTDEDAKSIYGERLFIASLAVVQEPGKIRVVHDGSNGVHVNHRI
jgi:hypothetical protein